MIQSYRNALGSNVWHFCSNCTTWPKESYVAALIPRRGENAELCTECVARHTIGDCEGDSDADFPGKRECPVIVNGKVCGLDLTQELATGYHVCPSGHRTLIVPPSSKR